MRWKELLAKVPSLSGEGAADPVVSALADDSRRAGPGTLFVARGGSKGDGGAFIQDAVTRGAVAVVVGPGVPVPAGVAVARVANPGAVTAEIAHAFHGFPARHLKVAGVTGTNGKTTIAFLLQQCMAAAGRKFGLVGTVLTDDGRQRLSSELTTPGAIELAGLLARMRDNGCTGVSMETSSHALDQGRVAGIEFAVATFTNLSGDHLDYHGTMESYADAKARLFEGLSNGAWAVVNADDPAHRRMLRDCRARVVRCGFAGGEALDAEVAVLEARLGSMRVRLQGPWGELQARLPMMGRHNGMNALQAVAASWALGVERGALEQAMAGAKAPPGRLEPVTDPDAPFAVMVDYAHTDDALLNVLRAVRPALPQGGRLIVVFGCGGDRDRTKRPRMARVACEFADAIVITSDNPRTEDPEAIIAEIGTGVPPHRADRVTCVTDRREAIHHAVQMARPGDAVVIAGKGHEDYQIVGTVKRSFDDREVAREALATVGSSA
jgi:UDP-N-acetylmuramoyl-L-alanyl-D-glutamate--2,6-diaminopimelate ligase